MKFKFTCFFVFCFLFQQGFAQDSIETLTHDGAWCWFSDPRSIYVDNDQIIAGWVKKDGTVEVASLNPKSGNITTQLLFPQMEVDDHNNPAFALLPDQNILSMYTWHSTKKGVIFQKTSKPGDITSFSDTTVIRPGVDSLLQHYPRETFTYANPFYLSVENKLYSFGRWIGFKPNMIQSADYGNTWQKPRVIISSEPFHPGNRPYVKYASDSKTKIHLVFTDGHPRNEPLNSVYHCYYEADAFWRSDGSRICTIDELPFDPEEATVVYKATEAEGRAWLADLAIDELGNPVILYTRHPEETHHIYHYATYDKDKQIWSDQKICEAGKWFPQTPDGEDEREPHYHGNMAVHPGKTNVIYVSRQINDRFEIIRMETDDNGKTWDSKPVTENSTYDQVRPYVPAGTPGDGPNVVLWMENHRYIHYTDFDSTIRYWVDPD